MWSWTRNPGYSVRKYIVWTLEKTEVKYTSIFKGFDVTTLPEVAREIFKF